MGYIVLDNRTSNVGDFLLHDVLLKCLKKYKDNPDIKIFPIKESLEEHLSEINDSQGIICYGSILDSYFYPETIRFTRDIEKIKVPIHFVGVGQYVALNLVNDLPYIESKLISRTNENIVLTRGPITYSHIIRNLIKSGNIPANNIQSNIDLAYHDDGNKKKIFKTPNGIKKIGISSFFGGMGDSDLVDYFKKVFQDSELFILDHGEGNREESGCSIEDVTYYSMNKDIKRLEIYKKLDLHVGYRLHAHIYALKCGVPSHLLIMDTRGLDNQIAMQTSDVNRILDRNWLQSLSKIIEWEIKHKFKNFNHIPLFIKTYNEKFIEHFNQMP